MKHNEPIRILMTENVQTVEVGDPMSKVRRLMMEGGFHHVPVLDGEEVVGIVSTRDLMRLSYSLVERTSDAVDAALDRQYSLEKVMETDLISLRMDEPIQAAVDLLADGCPHSVLILNKDDSLVGIVTNIDLLEYLFD
jgi:CBS-domain-containing membrane protein